MASVNCAFGNLLGAAVAPLMAKLLIGTGGTHGTVHTIVKLLLQVFVPCKACIAAASTCTRCAIHLPEARSEHIAPLPTNVQVVVLIHNGSVVLLAVL